MGPRVARVFLSLVLAILLAPMASHAQPPAKVPRVGFLFLGSPATQSNRVQLVREGLRELGFVEGRNIAFEVRWAEGRVDRVPDLAAELVGLKPDVIVTSGANLIVRALKQETQTIPIVVAIMSDPVGWRFAASFARPGGNITGLGWQDADLSTKRLQLLKEVLPKLSRLAVLYNPRGPSGDPSRDILRITEAAARSLGLTPQILEVRGPDGFERVFEAAKRERAQALFQVASPLFAAHRKTLVDLAMKSRLPATCETKEFVVLGCLMSYGPSFDDMFRRTATNVAKILKGAKPGDLPIEQPMRFELFLNLKTAKALGLAVPQSVLAQTDQVIQ